MRSDVVAVVGGTSPNGGSLPVDLNAGLVTYDPGVVPRGDRRDVTRALIELGPIFHHGVDSAGDGDSEPGWSRPKGRHCIGRGPC